MVLQQKFMDDEKSYQIFLEELKIVNEKKREQLEKENKKFQENPEEKNNEYKERKLFQKRVKNYIKDFQQKQKKNSDKWTLTKIYIEAGFDYNSWYRMLDAFGRGKQYRDKLRCLCFVLQLDFLKANEFLLLVGQPLDFCSKRDFYISECLKEGVYSKEKINERLEKHDLKPLFVYKKK